MKARITAVSVFLALFWLSLGFYLPSVSNAVFRFGMVAGAYLFSVGFVALMFSERE